MMKSKIEKVIRDLKTDCEVEFENRATDYAKGALSGNWDSVWGKAA